MSLLGEEMPFPPGKPRWGLTYSQDFQAVIGTVLQSNAPTVEDSTLFLLIKLLIIISLWILTHF